MNSKFEVTFLGTNGSCAYHSGRRSKYGNNTPCIAVKVGEEILIFDSGTGICGFGELNDYQRGHFHLLFSHYHIDHIGGLLFFPGFFDMQKEIELYGSGDGKQDLQGILNNILSPPLHPVGLDAFKARLHFHTIYAGESMICLDNVKIHTYPISHPGGVVGYRVEYAGKVFCYCTDIELNHHQADDRLLEFTRHADLLVLDSFFDDGKVIPGWGHSSASECAKWAIRADAKRLALFHYGFTLCDNEIDAMLEKTKKVFPGTFAASDGMRIEL